MPEHLDPLADSMDNGDMHRRIQQLMSSLNRPSFLIFGWTKADGSVGIVASFNEMDAMLAIKGMTWALNDFVSKINLPPPPRSPLV